MLINNSKKGFLSTIQNLPLWVRRSTAKFLVGLLNDYLDNLPKPVVKVNLTKSDLSTEEVSDVVE